MTTNKNPLVKMKTCLQGVSMRLWTLGRSIASPAHYGEPHFEDLTSASQELDKLIEQLTESAPPRASGSNNLLEQVNAPGPAQVEVGPDAKTFVIHLFVPIGSGPPLQLRLQMQLLPKDGDQIAVRCVNAQRVATPAVQHSGLVEVRP